MTSGKWFSSWLWVSATLIIIHILWTCQQHLPSFSESTKIKFTSLSLNTHRWLICSGVLIVFSSLYLQSLRTYLKIITKAANPDFQIRKYSLIYELFKLGVTDKASSFITGNSSPACFSLPVHGSKTPFQMRLQQHSLINLGSRADDTGPWPLRPASDPRCPAVLIDVMFFWMQSCSLNCFWWNSIPGKHLDSLYWLDLCRHLSIFWELFFKCWKTSGFT